MSNPKLPEDQPKVDGQETKEGVADIAEARTQVIAGVHSQVEKQVDFEKFDRLRFNRLREYFRGKFSQEQAADILSKLDVFVLVEDIEAVYRPLQRYEAGMLSSVKIKIAKDIESFKLLMLGLENVQTLLLLDNQINGGYTSEWLMENPDILKKENCYAFSFSDRGDSPFEKIIEKGLMFPREHGIHAKGWRLPDLPMIVEAYMAAKAYRQNLDDVDFEGTQV